MARILKESKWNPVNLGSRGGNYNITTTAISSNWYNQQIDNSGSRFTRLKRYEDADCCSIEISRGLDILAQDISSSNADDEPIFYLEYDDEKKVKKSTISLANEMVNLWKKRTKMEDNFYNRVRDTLKYGMQCWRKQPDGSLKKIYIERLIGYILADDDETTVTHYIHDPNGKLLEHEKNHAFRTVNKKDQQRQLETIPVSDLVIMKLGDKPFGESIIEKVYGTWRKLAMLEDAMVIYRVVRAPERRVYYIDTGNLQGPKREAAIEKQRLRLMQKQASKQGADITTEYDPHSTSEDIFIPTNSQGKGSRVETLPAGSSLGETGDLSWFHKKLAAGLKIPSSMLDVQSDEGGREQFNDMRVGQVYQVEIRYMGYVKRIQRELRIPLHENFVEFCQDREFILPDGAELRINAPTSFIEYKDMEVHQAKLNVYNSTLQIGPLSKKTAMSTYLMMDQEEILNNEENKLKEMGLTDEQIKQMPQNVRENIVYGDARLGADYGIEMSQGRF